jgi:hypothetical protein
MELLGRIADSAYSVSPGWRRQMIGPKPIEKRSTFTSSRFAVRK